MIAPLQIETLVRTQPIYLIAHTSSRPLLGRLLNNEVTAFEELYRMYLHNIFGVILKIVNQQETAEDLLQEVFLKIERYLPDYDENKGRLFTWMINIARNTAIDHLRLRSSRQQGSTFEIKPHHIEMERYSHSINTDALGLRKHLEALSPKQRKILDLCYYSGYTHQEIADELGMPLGSVKTTLRQAILKLREIFHIPSYPLR